MISGNFSSRLSYKPVNMDFDLQLKWDIKLENFAAVSATIYFWEMPDVQQMIQNHFVECYDWSDDDRSKWNEIRSVVRDRITSLRLYLPEKVLTELYLIESVVQEKIYFWHRYVMEELELDPRFAGKIYWDSQARIDERRVYQEFWRNEKDFFVATLVNNHKSRNVVIAFEEFVQRNPKEAGNKALEMTKKMLINADYFLIALLTKHAEGESTNSARIARGLAEAQGLSFNMIYKFLESKLVENDDVSHQRRHTLACRSLKKIRDSARFNRYMTDKQIDIFLHIFNQFSAENKVSFFFENKKLFLNAFLEVWPYQTIFIQILNFVAKVDLDQLQEVYPELLRRITKIRKKRGSHVPEIYEKVDDYVFLKILDMMGRDYKRQAILSTDICKKLLESHSFRIMLFIMSDPDLSDLENEIIRQRNELFRTYVRDFKFDEIDRCMSGLQFDLEDVAIMKVELDPLPNTALVTDYVKRGQFENLAKLIIWFGRVEGGQMADYAKQAVLVIIENCVLDWQVLRRQLDEFLRWSFDTDEELVDFLFQLDLTIYRSLIKKLCASGFFTPSLNDNILAWQSGFFKKVNEALKLEIKSDVEFINDQFCKLWEMNYNKFKTVHRAEVESIPLLNWFYESNEVAFHKRKKLLERTNLIKRVCDHKRKWSNDAQLPLISD